MLAELLPKQHSLFALRTLSSAGIELAVESQPSVSSTTVQCAPRMSVPPGTTAVKGGLKESCLRKGKEPFSILVLSNPPCNSDGSP